MTIKRRLFISNILMIILPIFLSFLTINIATYLLAGIYDDRPFKDRNGLDHAKTQLTAVTAKISFSGKMETIETDIDSFNAKYGESGFSLSLYQGKELLYPLSSIEGSPLLDIALSQNHKRTFTMDGTALYRENAGKYTVLLTNTNHKSSENWADESYRNAMVYVGIGGFLVMIVIILMTNRFLTQFMFKKITTPLDALVYGVHQVRDGNLSYRIEYTNTDEFASVCEDFNEMAVRLKESVNRSQKDEQSRKELLAGISHDLRTPLTSIRAYVEGLLDGVADDPTVQRRYLETIRAKAKDIDSIVDKLFLFSKLDIGEFPFYPEKVDIGGELVSMSEAFGEEYESKGITLALAQNVQNIYVYADPLQLRNAIINVLENSVKYKNKEHGTIKVKCFEETDNVTVCLTDDGPGVPQDTLGRLFDVFYRGDAARGDPSNGSGLGLAITAKILERLGGKVHAENSPDGGLCIMLSLPKYIDEV